MTEATRRNSERLRADQLREILIPAGGQAAYLDGNALVFRDAVGNFNVIDYGADPTGVEDSTNAIQAAIDDAAAAITINSSVFLTNWQSTYHGGQVRVPRGTYKISSNLTGYDRVGFKGDGPFASTIFASEGFNASMMVNWNTGANVFDVLIEGMTFHAANRSGITRILRCNAFQEGCEINHCALTGYQSGAVGVLAEDSLGNSAGWAIRNTKFFGFSSTKAGIEVNTNVANAHIMTLDTITVDPTSGTQGLLIDGGILNGRSLHIEGSADGVVLATDADAFITAASATSGVTNVIKLPAAYTGSLRAFIVDPNGGTNALMNNTTPTAGFAAELSVN